MKQIIMIGSPLTHVRSPFFLRALIAADKRDIAVNLRELGIAELPTFVDEARRMDDLLGMIVTTPLKNAICGSLDRRTADVDFIGASNCVRCGGGTWSGANFDGYGFAAALRDAIDMGTRRRILLFGCGAAGSAIAASLVAIADVDLFLFDIDATRAAHFAKRLQGFAPASSITAVPSPFVEADIVINASTAGMSKGDTSPIPDSILRRASVVGDIVVDSDTALKREARACGKILIEGEAMVKGQAEYLYRFILGEAASEREVLAAEP
ncbi:MAG: shikimate dehydrogenase [Parvibaculaceae bacterium]